jgi:branched-chain amino acid aminotransferase
MAFSLSVYPWIYEARYEGGGKWSERFYEQPHLSPAEEAALPDAERAELERRRNTLAHLPFVSYTNQYGLGCFEGLKALPQKGGGLSIFRPDRNAARMRTSMMGLRMPGFPESMFVEACVEMVKRNAALGFAPAYVPAWESEGFSQAGAVYIRPFSYAEGGIGIKASEAPSVYIVSTYVSSYFSGSNHKAVTTKRVRATPGGTGWIKCDANYVTSILAKSEANAAGYMEVIFLDARENRYVEEGSSCNIFFLLKTGVLVTPDLGDTILPGITRSSVIELARAQGIKVEERRISIDEAMSDSKEVFVTGTAAGLTPIESITHDGRTAAFSMSDQGMGELTRELLLTLKGIQYGAKPDEFGWMHKVV